MRRFISVILVIIFVLTLPILTSASELSSNVVNIGSTTVKYSADSGFSAEEQQIIAQRIVDGSINSQTTTYNVLCNLFGHKTTTESITVIEHCVSDTQPRCLQSFHEVTSCSRCDYVDIVEITSIYIYCCE
ncbi:MAG: hypothetical protein IKK74_11315 [Clostridia bacterium]|nr:hypothetical protein [Clostridia bacterium]